MVTSPFRERQRRRWEQGEVSRVAASVPPAGRVAALWQRAGAAWKLLAGLSGAASLAVAAVVVASAVMDQSIVIQPLSVPKPVADAGFTAEVAALHLRDALQTIKTRANTSRQGRAVLPQSDELNIVVPALGVPVQSIAAPIRAALGLKQHKVISGEVATVGGLLVLTLRQDGRLIYTSSAGADPGHPANLMENAALALLRSTDPYIFALHTSNTDKLAGLQLARAIVATAPLKDIDALYARNLTALLLKDFGRHDEAIKEQLALIRLDPGNAMWHGNFGISLRDKGILEEAKAEMAKAIELDPHFELAHAVLGDLLKQSDKFDEAENEYRRAIDLDPTDADVRFNLGILQQERHRDIEAISAYETSLAFNPNNSEVHANLGIVLVRLGKLDEAETEFREAIRLDPNTPHNYTNLAILFRDRGNLKAA